MTRAHSWAMRLLVIALALLGAFLVPGSSSKAATYIYDGAPQLSSRTLHCPAESAPASTSNFGPATAARAGPASGAASGFAAEDSTTLYRAVDPNELADVRATGQFRAGGPSMSGKFFAENPEDAAQWGQTLNGGQGAVVGTRVPSSFADQLMRWEKLDGIGPARYVDESQLSEFNRLLSGIWEVS